VGKVDFFITCFLNCVKAVLGNNLYTLLLYNFLNFYTLLLYNFLNFFTLLLYNFLNFFTPSETLIVCFILPSNMMVSISSTFFASIFCTKVLFSSYVLATKSTFVRKTRTKNVDEIDSWFEIIPQIYRMNRIHSTPLLSNPKFLVAATLLGIIL